GVNAYEDDRPAVHVAAVASRHARRHRHDLRGLGIEERTRDEDHRGAEVVHGAAAVTALQADVLGILHANRGVAAEGLRRADGTAADKLDELAVRGMRLHVIRDHELHTIGLTRTQHAAAFVGHHGHRSFADDVNTGTRSLYRVIAVQ